MACTPTPPLRCPPGALPFLWALMGEMKGVRQLRAPRPDSSFPVALKARRVAGLLSLGVDGQAGVRAWNSELCFVTVLPTLRGQAVSFLLCPDCSSSLSAG